MGVIKYKNNTYGGLGSGGVVDTSIIKGSTNAVSGGAVYEALENKTEIIPITQIDYDALSEEQKNDENIIYDITDKTSDVGTLSERIAELEDYLTWTEEDLCEGVKLFYCEAIRKVRIVYNYDFPYEFGHNVIAEIPTKYTNMKDGEAVYSLGVSLNAISEIIPVMAHVYDNEFRIYVGSNDTDLTRFRGYLEYII